MSGAGNSEVPRMEHRFESVTYLRDAQISDLINDLAAQGWRLAGSMFDMNAGCRLIFARGAAQNQGKMGGWDLSSTGTSGRPAPVISAWECPEGREFGQDYSQFGPGMAPAPPWERQRREPGGDWVTVQSVREDGSVETRQPDVVIISREWWE